MLLFLNGKFKTSCAFRGWVSWNCNGLTRWDCASHTVCVEIMVQGWVGSKFSLLALLVLAECWTWQPWATWLYSFEWCWLRMGLAAPCACCSVLPAHLLPVLQPALVLRFAARSGAHSLPECQRLWASWLSFTGISSPAPGPVSHLTAVVTHFPLWLPPCQTASVPMALPRGSRGIGLLFQVWLS